MPLPVPEQARLLAEETRRITGAFRSLALPLSPAQLAWAPPRGGWTVGQVLEHLVIANGMYLALCEALVARGRPATTPVTWSPSLMGGWLARALAPEARLRLPAPRDLRPGPAPRGDVLAVFLATQDRLATLIGRAAPLDWSRLRGGSPETALIRLDLGDAFQILVNHTARHYGQAHRITAMEAFPRA